MTFNTRIIIFVVVLVTHEIKLLIEIHMYTVDDASLYTNEYSEHQ